MLRAWRSALRIAVRAKTTPHHIHHSHAVAATRLPPAVPFRSLSVQHKTPTTACSSADTAASHLDPSLTLTPPLRKRKSHEKSTAPSIRVCERVLAAPDSSYSDALHAFEYLRDHRDRLKERHYLALLEKASVEQQYSAIRTHFASFCEALNANQIALYRSSKATWSTYQSERLQIHRHVLWAMLQHCPSTTRFRTMQRHFRKHELASMRNRLELYESDALNFLLRMECTFSLVDPLARDQGQATWRTRVMTILNEMRTLRFRTNYSSSHALFHFLMHRPDVAIGDRTTSGRSIPEEDEGKKETFEDQAIYDLLTTLLDAYPQTLERDPRRLSLAVSTAASAGRLWLAVRLLREADTRKIAVDAASFAHVVAMAKDEATRLAIADLYVRAKEHDRLYDGDDTETTHSMKKYVLLYAIHDGNFTQIMELLHEMEYHQIPAPPRTVAMLFASIATYRAKIRAKYQGKDASTLAAALQECPSVLQLMTNFPAVIHRTTHTGSQAVLHALRSGDIDVALAVLRTTVQHTKIPLRPEVFSQVLYAVLVSDATTDATTRDVLAAHQVQQLYDARYPGQRAVVNAQLLNLCESNHDLETMVTVLDNWHMELAATAPLSKRALQRVFDVISAHLKAIRKQVQEDDDVRYRVGNLELSFRRVLEKYPLLVPLEATTLNQALMRSATAQLVDDVGTLLRVAHTQHLTIEPVVYKAALDVLCEASKADSNAAAQAALRESIEAMEANGSWQTLSSQFPEYVATLQTSMQSEK